MRAAHRLLNEVGQLLETRTATSGGSVPGASPGSAERHATTSTSASRVGVVSVSPSRVTVSLFLNQTPTTVADPNSRLSGSRVRVVSDRAGDDWRMSELTPV